MKISDLNIIVCSNKSDYFLTFICIASIRYFYPDIKIYLVKDLINGHFDTSLLEKKLCVESLDFGIKKMGWSAAKFHLHYNFPINQKLLVLDSDIVFVSPFLEGVLESFDKYDYIINAEYESDPYASWVKDVYFDVKAIEETYPEYKYPGYFFNAGQIFLTTGSVPINIFNLHFDHTSYPYWINSKLFPLVDQSVYNYLLPTLHRGGSIKLGEFNFMVWANSGMANNIKLFEVLNKTCEKGLIHWAGCTRSPFLSLMLNKEILQYFQSYYYHLTNQNLFQKHFDLTKIKIDYILGKVIMKIKNRMKLYHKAT